MKKIAILFIGIVQLFGCSGREKPADDTLWVTILPLRELIRSITGDDFPIEVLVPPGASPETFEPTARQRASLNGARMVFSVGLIDFERNLLHRTAHSSRIVDLSEGVEPIAGRCTHAGHRHTHGTDPHIWTSPQELRIMAANAYRAIHAAFPDSMKYACNYARLKDRLNDLDRKVKERIERSGATYFLIYHPALTYYARAYGIRQVAVEDEGKEPSARRLATLLGQARRDGIRCILYQKQFPASTVEVIARDLQGRAAEIDPLAENIMDEILTITDLIASQQ